MYQPWSVTRSLDGSAEFQASLSSRLASLFFFLFFFCLLGNVNVCTHKNWCFHLGFGFNRFSRHFNRFLPERQQRKMSARKKVQYFFRRDLRMSDRIGVGYWEKIVIMTNYQQNTDCMNKWTCTHLNSFYNALGISTQGFIDTCMRTSESSSIGRKNIFRLYLEYF